jgi:hypothetical protein
MQRCSTSAVDLPMHRYLRIISPYCRWATFITVQLMQRAYQLELVSDIEFHKVQVAILNQTKPFGSNQ